MSKKEGKFKIIWKKIECNPWLYSLAEVLFTLLVSNAAVLVAAYIFMLNQVEPVEISVWSVFADQLMKFIKPTEIIVFILAIIAPTIWILLKNVEGWKHLRFWAFLLIIQVVVVVVSVVIFATSLAGFANNKSLTNSSAVFCLFFAIVVWYITLVYQKAVIDKSGDQIEPPTAGNGSGEAILKSLEGR